jgi:hypothetical protein
MASVNGESRARIVLVGNNTDEKDAVWMRDCDSLIMIARIIAMHWCQWISGER